MSEKLSTRQRQLREAEEQAQAVQEHGDATDLVVPGPSQFPGEAEDQPTSPADLAVREVSEQDAEPAQSDAREGRKATPHGDTEPRSK